MEKINLNIVCPDGLLFSGAADFVKIRSLSGDIGIIGAHSDYFTVIDLGECVIRTKDGERSAACSDGFLMVKDKTQVQIVATTFEWADEIDLSRAESALEESKKTLSTLEKSSSEYQRYLEKIERAKLRAKLAKKQEKERD